MLPQTSARAANPPWWSRRVRMSHLALIASFVISVLAAFTAYRGWAHARATADSDLLRDAETAALVAEEFVHERISTLRALAQTPALNDSNPETDQLILDSLEGVANFRSYSIVDSDGYVVAITGGLPEGRPVWVGDRDQIRGVLRTGLPAVGPAVNSRVIEGVAVPFAVPMDQTSGARGAILGAGLYVADTEGLRFSPDTSLKLIDSQRQVILDATRQLQPLATTTAWSDWTRVGTEQSDVFTGTGLTSGTDSVIAFASVPTAGWTIVLEHPGRELYSAANVRFQQEVAAVLTFFTSTVVVILYFDRRGQAQVRAELAAHERAEQAVASRNEFVERVVHDLRSPLTVAKAAIQLAERRGTGPRDRFGALTRQALAELEAMLDELADGRTDRITLAAGWLDGRELLARLIEHQRVIDPTRMFALALNVTPGASTEVHWDAALIARAIENLLSNARKYSDTQTPIAVEASFDLDRVSISVKDEGRGIPARDLPHVAEAFQRGSNVDGTPGVGLGLANVATIAGLHGGTVDIVSREGRGTTVTLRVPVSPRATDLAALLSAADELPTVEMLASDVPPRA